MIQRRRVFYLHFNKVAERRGDPKVWSIRTSKGCFHARAVHCDVPLVTVYKAGKAQPRALLKGYGFVTLFEGDTVVITRTPLQ